MSYDIKKLLKEREKNYIKKSEEIIMGFLQPLKKAIENVIYDGEDIQLVIKGVEPITKNLDYISLTLATASYSIGDIVPVRDDPESDSFQRTVEIDEENFWSFSDTLNINAPIVILETKDEDTITEFLREIYHNDVPIPDDEETPQTVEDLLKLSKNKEKTKSEFEDFDEYKNMDDAQRKIFELYNSNNSEH
jgi:hypothetical protein